jgi:hypothetical protein
VGNCAAIQPRRTVHTTSGASILARANGAFSRDKIAPIVDRSVVATRQLASRARRRVQGQTPTSDADLQNQRRVVEVFLAAVQDGDFEALIAVLDPAIVLRAYAGAVKGMIGSVGSIYRPSSPEPLAVVTLLPVVPSSSCRPRPETLKRNPKRRGTRCLQHPVVRQKTVRTSSAPLSDDSDRSARAFSTRTRSTAQGSSAP